MRKFVFIKSEEEAGNYFATNGISFRKAEGEVAVSIRRAYERFLTRARERALQISQGKQDVLDVSFGWELLSLIDCPIAEDLTSHLIQVEEVAILFELLPSAEYILSAEELLQADLSPADLYVLPLPSFQWLYATTHELQFGPYVYAE